MRCLSLAAIAAMTLSLPGCADTQDGFFGGESQGGYATPGYYGGSPGYSQGYSPQPYYATPYPNQPAYISPYPYQPSYAAPNSYEYYGGGRDIRRERREHSFENEGRHPENEQHQRFDGNRNMGAQPTNLTPVAPMRQPPPRLQPAAPAQVQQNQKLLDQLGFRPNR